nr:MAG TPA: hypothetical protein [Caudoviricetes sp.]
MPKCTFGHVPLCLLPTRGNSVLVGRHFYFAKFSEKECTKCREFAPCQKP